MAIADFVPRAGAVDEAREVALASVAVLLLERFRVWGLGFGV